MDKRGPLTSFGATKKRDARGDILYPVLPSNSEASLTSLGATKWGVRGGVPRGPLAYARGDIKGAFGATKRGAFGATKKGALGAT
jgi:hypothetical protein